MDFSRPDLPKLAFVDVETTGVDPRENRITEIGVVCVDGDAIREWSTVINPLARRREHAPAPEGITDEMRLAAPRFKDIAADLAGRLAGRLMVAHNARFDYSFLKAEFSRVGIEFHPDVLCSLMLSRKLYAQFAHHDADSLIEHHALEVEVRHRALHDAKLIWQFWQLIHREVPRAAIANAIELLKAGPLLPAHLHPSLIDRLPDAPGVYVLHGEDDEVLMTGTALNLRLRVLNYFRLDHMSGRAARDLASNPQRELASHAGDARREAPARAAAERVAAGAGAAKRSRLLLALRPRRITLPVAHVARRPAMLPRPTSCSACSSRPGRRAMHSFASRQPESFAICCSESMAVPAHAPAAGLNPTPPHATAGRRVLSTSRAHSPRCGSCAFRPGPMPGPIGIRERSDLHIVDGWRYLGTARNDAEIHAVLETRAGAFNPRVFRLLAKTLQKLPERRIVLLATSPRMTSAPNKRADSARSAACAACD
jgi:DNA polymerase-3 subunit epsilon